MSFIRETWDRLIIDGEKAVGFVRLRIPTVRGCALYAARSQSTGSEALVVEIATRSIPGDAEFPRLAGLDVTPMVIEPGRSGRTRIVLALRDLRFSDVFRALSDDLVHRMELAEDETTSVRILMIQLARWQAFLRAAGADGLSLEVRRGLAGEMAFLRDELLPRMGDSAVGAWMGWAGANHDFQLPQGSVEHKTTIANTPHSFRVSNVGQLDDATTPALYVCLSYVHESQNTGESLYELIESIRQRLQPTALAALEDRLAHVGFVGGAGDVYPLPRYVMKGRRMYHVRAGFPRITADDLMSGVEHVEYTVALAACEPYSVDAEEILMHITTQELDSSEH
jgi:hypothetical protein